MKEVAYINKIMDKIKNKNIILNTLFSIIIIYLFAEMVRNLHYLTECMYEVFRNYYFYRASAFFLVIIIILRKINFRKIPIILTIISYIGYSVKYLLVHNNDYGEEYRSMLVAKFIAGGLLLLITVDIIISKNITRINRNNKAFVMISLITLAMILAINYEYSKTIIFPMLFFFLTPISRAMWKKLVNCFAIGYYLAFVWVVTVQLIRFPYKGDAIVDGKYQGFCSSSIAGAFVAGAFICSLYFLIKVTRDGWKSKWKIILCFLSMIYPLIATGIIGGRTPEIGIVTAVGAVYILFSSKGLEKIWKKRLLITSGIVLFLILMVVLLFAIIKNLNPEDIHIGGNGAFQLLETRILYWADRAKTAFVSESYYHVIPSGTVLNGIDRFSSQRLTVAIIYLRELNWFGHEDMVMPDWSGMAEMMQIHPHNTYVTWLWMYGIVGGLAMIVWFISYIVTGIKRLSLKDDTVYMTLIWAFYCLGVFLPDTILWTYLLGIVLLMLQYPMLIEQAEE